MKRSVSEDNIIIKEKNNNKVYLYIYDKGFYYIIIHFFKYL